MQVNTSFSVALLQTKPLPWKLRYCWSMFQIYKQVGLYGYNITSVKQTVSSLEESDIESRLYSFLCNISDHVS